MRPIWWHLPFVITDAPKKEDLALPKLPSPGYPFWVWRPDDTDFVDLSLRQVFLDTILLKDPAVSKAIQDGRALREYVKAMCVSTEIRADVVKWIEEMHTWLDTEGFNKQHPEL